MTTTRTKSIPSARWRTALLSAWPAVIALCAIAFWMSPCMNGAAAAYYVHPSDGNDAHSGTNPERPWRTLARANQAVLKAGDRVLLAEGQRFEGTLEYEGLQGKPDSPILIASYPAATTGGAGRPVIDAKGYLAGIHLKNSRYVAVEGLSITANAGGQNARQAGAGSMRCGVLVKATEPGEYAGFRLTNLQIGDVYYEDPGFERGPEEVKSANGTQRYGWGVRFIVTTPAATLRDVAISDCQIENVSHTGLKFTAPSNGLRNVTVQRLRVVNSGGPGIQMSGVRGGRFRDLDVSGSGSTNDSRNWGRGSGLWTWTTSDVVVERSRFTNANGPADSAGVHIDYHCRDVIVQHNLSANNAGGFCEILGNNHNTAYRYNISINDGHRVKGRNGAFQEGKIFWLSGYTGAQSPRQGPFNTYFYNNTIYVSADIVAKFAVAPTASGVLIANNIFCIRGRSELVTDDQFRPDNGGGLDLKNVVFRNNLFLHQGNWPKALAIQDHPPLLGDPQFRNGGGVSIQDYVPRNIELLRDRGLRISKIPGDEIGLVTGLEVQTDMLGNDIRELPDIGAIEVP